MATILEALTLAAQHHQAGRLQVAEQIYRQILAIDPRQSDAVHLIGVIAHQTGRLDLAAECFQQAIGLKGTNSAFHNNLGNVFKDLRKLDEAVACYRRALELKSDLAAAHFNLGAACSAQGKLDEAIDCFQQALKLQPDDAEAHYYLGNAWQAQGRLDEAITCYRRALELQPQHVEAHHNLGIAFKTQEKLDEAIACYRRALELQPGNAEAHHNLGIAFRAQGQLDDAIACYRRTLELQPDHAEAHYNLGNALQAQGKLDEAIACYRRALELQPDNVKTHNNLGITFKAQGKLDEAIASYHRALELTPDYASAHNNLGNALQAQGSLDEAITCYRRALELQPGFVEAHSNLLCTLNFCSRYDAKTIYEEHCHWNLQHAAPLAKLINPHSNECSARRRLRIGYVSPDFRNHVVGRFVLPLLEMHDHEHFEIYCYASVRVPDAMTDQCRAQADVWRNVFGISDEQFADIIRRDQIDVLVDLTMHMAHNRLLVFARKPAPVQVAYLAYVGTTGLSTMDYRLTDPYLDPPAQDDKSIYREESIRLPETYWCYRPLGQAPAVSSLPALAAGHITFGCLNNFCKVTDQTLAAWIALLQAMPEARLLLHAHSGKHRDRVRDLFARQGVSQERLTFSDKVPTAEYFQLYLRIDVALDPFPYGGGTTTCDALWMGVPVVSLAGQTAVGRGGLSILSNLGLAELVVHDAEQYVRIAVELAHDLPRLSKLRATLCDRMQGSPLMDSPRFARHVEAAYQAIWRRWCGSQPSTEMAGDGK